MIHNREELSLRQVESRAALSNRLEIMSPAADGKHYTVRYNSAIDI